MGKITFYFSLHKNLSLFVNKKGCRKMAQTNVGLGNLSFCWGSLLIFFWVYPLIPVLLLTLFPCSSSGPSHRLQSSRNCFSVGPLQRAAVAVRTRLLRGGLSTACTSFRAYPPAPARGPPWAAVWVAAPLRHAQGAIQLSEHRYLMASCQLRRCKSLIVSVMSGNIMETSWTPWDI